MVFVSWAQFDTQAYLVRVSWLQFDTDGVAPPAGGFIDWLLQARRRGVR